MKSKMVFGSGFSSLLLDSPQIVYPTKSPIFIPKNIKMNERKNSFLLENKRADKLRINNEIGMINKSTFIVRDPYLPSGIKVFIIIGIIKLRIRTLFIVSHPY
ncbi:hypothetical protein DSCO28_54600 [Desulfosarcina ovata subsp. sediminis]|uniref:Uncharacterized protein n=1 Tax=Desulfosarcina ovata subsp. sediminis TaxID=885957 RepID=A0A5K7ZXJ2_9BACT|nr:hypothetical protein DSCO28_54600 [Desulfosarcina ovata subsp. sediminis]